MGLINTGSTTLDSAVNAVGGVGWNLLTNMPKGTDDPMSASLDPAASNLVTKGAAQAGKSAEEYAAQNMKGAGEGGQDLQQSQEQAAQHATKTGQDPYFAQAAQQKYQSMFGKNQYDMGKQNALQAHVQRANAMNQYAAAIQGQQAAVMQQQQFLTNVANQQEMMRAGTINSLFQTGDVAIGMNAGGAFKNKGQANQPSPQQPGQVGGYAPDGGLNYNYGGDMSGQV